MSGAGTAGQTPSTTATRRRVLSIALWVLQALLALQFAMAGLAKVGGDPAMVEMFATIGIGQWFRYLVGALEIAGAIGVLIPRLSGLAALGLVCLMAGAILTNLFVLGASPMLPSGLLVMSAVVAWGRRAWTRAFLGGLGRRAVPAGRIAETAQVNALDETAVDERADTPDFPRLDQRRLS
jgi:putative oxidoreductase